MRHWQTELSKREYNIECGRDNVCHLMSELRIKDSLLHEKDNIIDIKEREIDDIKREAQNNATQQVEVKFVCFNFSVTFVYCCRIL